MQYDGLSPEERQLFETVQAFTQKELFPIELECDARDDVPDEVFRALRRKLADLGVLGVDVPEEYGGAAMGVLAYSLVREALGMTSQALSFVGLPGPIKMFLAGTEDQRQKYIPPIVRGETMAAFAVTEPAAGSDAGAMETFAARDGDSWVLNGTKHYITQGPVADYVIVFALTDREKRQHGGISAFIVERGMPGFRIGNLQHFLGWRGVPEGELVFEDCRVPNENLLGPVGGGFRTVMKFLDEGRIAVAATCVGRAQRLLDLTVEHARARHTFGKRLGDHQSVQNMVADSMTELHAARLLVRDAARKIDSGKRATTECSMAKLFGSEAGYRVADRALQIHGGMGLSKEMPIEMLYRDLRVARIVEGASEIQRLLIARAAFA